MQPRKKERKKERKKTEQKHAIRMNNKDRL
jgi:hypothetical protein